MKLCELRRLVFDIDPSTRDPQNQQIVLLNRGLLGLREQIGAGRTPTKKSTQDIVQKEF